MMSRYKKFQVMMRRCKNLLQVGILGSIGHFAYRQFQDKKVSYTKRKRLLLTSPEWEREQGDIQYKQLLQQYKKDILPPNHIDYKPVRRVGSRIADAAAKTTSKRAPYTYTVVRSEQANAFVLPNNHVFVFTGLFKYIQNDDDLAAVLGHEEAHNLARHSGERLWNSIINRSIVHGILGMEPSGFLFAVSKKIFVPHKTLLPHDLPHSRKHKEEADYIGLQLAAEACYDPKAAKRVFGAMKEENSTTRSALQEFFSTRSSYDTRLSNFDNTRLSNFDKWLPEALDKYNECQRIRNAEKLARKHHDAALASIRFVLLVTLHLLIHQ